MPETRTACRKARRISSLEMIAKSFQICYNLETTKSGKGADPE